MANYSGIYLGFEGTTAECNTTQQPRETVYDNNSGLLRYMTAASGYVYVQPHLNVITESGGLVGIGVSPLDELHVQADTTGSVVTRITNQRHEDTNSTVDVSFYGGFNSTQNEPMVILRAGKEQAWADLGTTRDSYLGIYTSQNASSNLRMKLDSDGFLGLGNSATVSPTRLLDVGGTTKGDMVARFTATNGASSNRGCTFIGGDGTADDASWDNALIRMFNYAGGADTVISVGSTDTYFYSAGAGDVGIGIAPAGAKLDVRQTSTSGAKPVLKLRQQDIDDTFIDFVGTVNASGAASISTDTTEDSSKYGAIRCEINGVTKWIRIYDNES